MKVLGIVLVVLGFCSLAWGGFSYMTTEHVLDVGPIHATREKEHNVPIAPLAGVAALVGGIVLLVSNKS